MQEFSTELGSSAVLALKYSININKLLALTIKTSWVSVHFPF